ncbi:MAG TPA: phosphate ABC transporter permease PstA [Solirubrobacteraceae bacterium]
MTELFDPTAPLAASGNLRRREIVSRLATGGAMAAAVLAIGVLAIVVYSVVHRGGSSGFNLDFLTKPPPLFGGPGGGIAPELVGTLVIVTLATVIAAPVGVLLALYLTEFAGRRSARIIGSAMDLMQGLPSIIVAVFVFGFLVAGVGQSGYAGAAALAIIMLPLIARSSQEVILLVPNTLREAAEALGVGQWRTIVGVVLPNALSGIVTGVILAVARAAGETAPMLVLSSVFAVNQFKLDPFTTGAVPNIPFFIYNLVEQPQPGSIERAWGAAFVLLTMILIANFIARLLLARSRRTLAR